MKALLAVTLAYMFLFQQPLFGQPSSRAPVTPIHAAALQGNIEAIREHIEAGSDLNAKDAYGSTPLTVAATFGKPEVVRVLMEAGADPYVTDNSGSTPLHIAAFFGRLGIVNILLERGADRYARNNNGSTPLDIVSSPFEEDRALYDQLRTGLGPLGLVLDYEQIKATRPKIAAVLRPQPRDLSIVEYSPIPGNDWEVSTPADEGLDPMPVAEFYHDASKMENLFGVLAIKNGRLIAERYYNGGAIDQKARLQSVTKSYTSALVGIAMEQGCLSGVDQKMIAFFPELTGRIDDPRKELITIRHLLQMRAGYPWEESTEELFTLLFTGFRPSTLAEVELTRDPGSGYDYSNLSSHILGIIVARACDTDLRSFARKHLFEPLGVEAGEWIRDWEGYYNGHADLHLTARDAAKFGLMYLNEGEYAGQQILPARWVRESLQTYSEHINNSGGISNGSVGRYFRNIGYGYQWWSARVGDRRFNLAWGHGGQLIVLLDELDMVIVVTSNPFYKQHNTEAWKHEQANINMVGKFINSLQHE